MNNIGIFYGSTTGTTEDIARRIAGIWGLSETQIHDASTLTPALAESYNILILGTSTWGSGELQDDWYEGVKILKKTDLSHTSIALFGCGDSDSYADTFCDGIGILYEELKETGCQFIGMTPTDDYTFDTSIAVVDNSFVGLPLDEVNEYGKTDERLAHWVEQLKAEIS